MFKPQYVDRFSEEAGTATEFLTRSGVDAAAALRSVGLSHREDRPVAELSGGELQLLAIGRTVATDADLYLIDEPSSYLDIVHRLEIARLLRRLGETKSVVVVEHDLALLDYLADQAHLVYGEEAAFGVISHPIAMRSAINTYLTGYLKDENVRSGPSRSGSSPTLRSLPRSGTCSSRSPRSRRSSRTSTSASVPASSPREKRSGSSARTRPARPRSFASSRERNRRPAGRHHPG